MADLKQIIEEALQKRFANERSKQRVVVASDRLNFACPYCGDSAKSSSKKRGNLWLESASYKCYNCGHYSSQKRFLKSLVEMDLYFEKIPENLLVNSNYDGIAGSFNPATISTLSNDLEEMVEKYSLTREKFKRLFSLVEVKGTKIEKYLNSRCIFNYDNFLYDELNHKLFILNRDAHSDRIIAYQIRNFNNPNFKYLTYKLETMYRECRKEIPDEEDFQTLNTISKYFNILNINIRMPITYFEGPIDAYFYKNAVSLTSIETKPIIETKSTQYLFDCDKRGNEESRKLLKEKKKVFMWRKFLKDIKMEYPNPYSKVDFNDVIIYCAHNKLHPNFDKYFTDNSLDMINI